MERPAPPHRVNMQCYSQSAGPSNQQQHPLCALTSHTLNAKRSQRFPPARMFGCSGSRLKFAPRHCVCTEQRLQPIFLSASVSSSLNVCGPEPVSASPAIVFHNKKEEKTDRQTDRQLGVSVLLLRSINQSVSHLQGEAAALRHKPRPKA